MKGRIMKNSTYDRLKDLTLIYLPALATLYFALSQIWMFPFGPEVVATITTLTVFLGTTLKLRSTSYFEEMDKPLTPDIEDDELDADVDWEFDEEEQQYIPVSRDKNIP